MSRFEEFADDDGPLLPSSPDEPETLDTLVVSAEEPRLPDVDPIAPADDDPAAIRDDEEPPEDIEQVAPQAGEGAESPAAPWHTAVPGPELAAQVAAMLGAEEGLTQVSDFDLVELTAAAQRVASWAHYVSAAAAGELSDRAAMQPVVPEDFSGTLASERIVGEELSMRLGCTVRTAQNLAREGRAYDSELHLTGQALREGRIDRVKAKVIRDGLEDVIWQRALTVQEAVLPGAPARTCHQLAADVRRALVAIDPAEAVVARKRAESTRYLSKPKPLGDGMAGLWLRTTALDAHALYESIDAAARRARRAGDPRTLDQLRADQLVHRSQHAPVCTNAPAFADTGAFGKAGANTKPRLPGAPGSCRTAVRIDVRVLVPLSTLIGTDDAPAELEGYGLIDPEVSQAWAREGTWRRLVTDPYSGTVLDVGRTRYTPPADLAEHVRFRDLNCARPGCTTTAWHSELDHLRPYGTNRAPGGPTAAHNLTPLSKGCHQIKTHAGFNVKRIRPGTYRWTTPTGHTYDHDTPTPARGPTNPAHLFRLRHELEEWSPPPATRPPRATGDREASNARTHGNARADDAEPPPF